MSSSEKTERRLRVNFAHRTVDASRSSANEYHRPTAVREPTQTDADKRSLALAVDYYSVGLPDEAPDFRSLNHGTTLPAVKFKNRVTIPILFAVPPKQA
jgi:hypothetical protein